MDLTALLLRVAARRPHVLVAAVPGATDARLALEAALARRGWPVATGPADADVLAVAGSPGPELAAVIARVWQQVPAPRARIEVPAPGDVVERLDAAAVLLADAGHQRSSPAIHPPAGTGHHRDDGGRDRAGHDAHGEHGADAQPDRHAAPGDHTGHHQHAGHDANGEHGGDARSDGNAAPPDHTGHHQHAGSDDDHGEHSGHGQSGGHAEHADHAHEHGDHSERSGEAAGGHAGHDGGGHHGHHGHGGGTVAGLPMAELGSDRDGLTLDRLHVPLGPVLPDWPAGLVVRVTLQGDVIQEAAAEVLDVGLVQRYEWPSALARELDGLARFLGVAGWISEAGRARRLRDAVLAGEPDGQVAAEVATLQRRVRRSRTLRWMIRGIPAGCTNVATLLDARLAAIDAGAPGDPRPGVEELAGLLVGAELAAARLIVAAVDPDIDRVPSGKAARHG